MKYTLVKPDGTLGPSRDFDSAPPVLAATKGRWLPDAPPACNPMTHTLAVATPVLPGATSIPYTLTLRQPADVFADKLAQLAALRYEKEVAGVVIDGATIKTDRESQAAIAATYLSLKDGILNGVRWKGKNGWVSLTLPQARAIAKAVAEHVQACFQRESDLTDALQAIVDNPVGVANYDITTGWPG